jgi:hypothetical protein
MPDTLLPSAFAELEQFAQIWCLPTEAERWNKRLASTMAELREFYEAFFPRLDEAMDYCDKFALDDMPDDAVNLLYLVYSLVMVAMAVEIFKQPRPTDSADAVIDRIDEPVP